MTKAEMKEEIEEAFEGIQEMTPKYVDFLRDICNLEGMARDKARMDRIANYIEAFARREGFSVKRTPFETCGDFLTIDLNEGAEKSYLFLAHMDTVHEYGKFGNPPVTIQGDIMRGPGTIDCKGGIAVALLAMKELKRIGFPKHLRLILTSDEEISNSLGGEKEMEFIRKSVEGFKGALNCEVSEEGTAVVSRSGILRVKIDIAGKAAHSGINYFEGISAVREAAHKILALEGRSVPGGTTYNCGIIHGGDLANIVPERCSLVVDVRVHSLEEMDRAWETVRAVAQTSFVEGTEANLTVISRRRPMIHTQATDALFEKIRRVSLEYGLGDLKPVESGGGSDSAYTQAAGVPSVCALGTYGQFCHTDREYMKISSLPQRAELLAALCCEDGLGAKAVNA